MASCRSSKTAGRAANDDLSDIDVVPLLYDSWPGKLNVGYSDNS